MSFNCSALLFCHFIPYWVAYKYTMDFEHILTYAMTLPYPLSPIRPLCCSGQFRQCAVITAEDLLWSMLDYLFYLLVFSLTPRSAGEGSFLT